MMNPEDEFSAEYGGFGGTLLANNVEEDGAQIELEPEPITLALVHHTNKRTATSSSAPPSQRDCNNAVPSVPSSSISSSNSNSATRIQWKTMRDVAVEIDENQNHNSSTTMVPFPLDSEEIEFEEIGDVELENESESKKLFEEEEAAKRKAKVIMLAPSCSLMNLFHLDPNAEPPTYSTRQTSPYTFGLLGTQRTTPPSTPSPSSNGGWIRTPGGRDLTGFKLSKKITSSSSSSPSSSSPSSLSPPPTPSGPSPSPSTTTPTETTTTITEPTSSSTPSPLDKGKEPVEEVDERNPSTFEEISSMEFVNDIVEETTSKEEETEEKEGEQKVKAGEVEVEVDSSSISSLVSPSSIPPPISSPRESDLSTSPSSSPRLFLEETTITTTQKDLEGPDAIDTQQPPPPEQPCTPSSTTTSPSSSASTFSPFSSTPIPISISTSPLASPLSNSVSLSTSPIPSNIISTSPPLISTSPPPTASPLSSPVRGLSPRDLSPSRGLSPTTSAPLLPTTPTSIPSLDIFTLSSSKLGSLSSSPSPSPSPSSTSTSTSPSSSSNMVGWESGRLTSPVKEDVSPTSSSSSLLGTSLSSSSGSNRPPVSYFRLTSLEEKVEEPLEQLSVVEDEEAELEADRESHSDEAENEVEEEEEAVDLDNFKFPEELERWGVLEIGYWLRKEGFPNSVIQTFKAHKVTGHTLFLLEIEDLLDPHLLRLSEESATQLFPRIQELVSRFPTPQTPLSFAALEALEASKSKSSKLKEKEKEKEDFKKHKKSNSLGKRWTLTTIASAPNLGKKKDKKKMLQKTGSSPGQAATLSTLTKSSSKKEGIVVIEEFRNHHSVRPRPAGGSDPAVRDPRRKRSSTTTSSPSHSPTPSPSSSPGPEISAVLRVKPKAGVKQGLLCISRSRERSLTSFEPYSPNSMPENVTWMVTPSSLPNSSEIEEKSQSPSSPVSLASNSTSNSSPSSRQQETDSKNSNLIKSHIFSQTEPSLPVTKLGINSVVLRQQETQWKTWAQEETETDEDRQIMEEMRIRAMNIKQGQLSPRPLETKETTPPSPQPIPEPKARPQLQTQRSILSMGPLSPKRGKSFRGPLLHATSSPAHLSVVPASHTQTSANLASIASVLPAKPTPPRLNSPSFNSFRYSTALMKPVEDEQEEAELLELIRNFSVKFNLTRGLDDSDDDSSESASDGEEEVFLGGGEKGPSSSSSSSSPATPASVSPSHPPLTKTPSTVIGPGGFLLYCNPSSPPPPSSPVVVEELVFPNSSPNWDCLSASWTGAGDGQLSARSVEGEAGAGEGAGDVPVRRTRELIIDPETVQYIEMVVGKTHVRTNELRNELLRLLPAEASAGWSRVREINEELRSLVKLLQPFRLRRNALELNLKDLMAGIDEGKNDREVLEKLALSSALSIDRLTKIFILLKCEAAQTKDPLELEVLRLISNGLEKV
jgi:hypothetical protein